MERVKGIFQVQNEYVMS